MKLLPWESLPEAFRNDAVKPYYDRLVKKKATLFFKRVLDVVFSVLLMVLLMPLFLVLAAAIRLGSKGPVFYRQERVTQYGKIFRIHKLRSMVVGADTKGTLVTPGGDARVTRVGRFMRRFRLDEIGQLLDIFTGNMTFVGTRPEVRRYVDTYTPEMMATLLLPAGLTNLTSILFKDEEKFLERAEDVDKTYIEEVLPAKMKWNLKGLKSFSLGKDFRICLMTVMAMLGKEYAEREKEL